MHDALGAVILPLGAFIGYVLLDGPKRLLFDLIDHSNEVVAPISCEHLDPLTLSKQCGSRSPIHFPF
jgi:hypothetical protein